jgi:hypothetical protein
VLFRSFVNRLMDAHPSGLRGKSTMAGNMARGDIKAPGLVYVEPGDPRYLDARYWAKPGPEQSTISARIEQVQFIEAHKLPVRDRSKGSRQPTRVGDAIHLRELIPWRPYCADCYEEGVYRRSRQEALARLHLQINRDSWVDWLIFDIDRPDAHEAASMARLPEPTFVAVNPANGHGHLAYLLAVPVGRFDAANRKPIRYLADVQRGMSRRLGADQRYSGLLVKNPLHPDWLTEWRSSVPFGLGDLNAELEARDKRPFPLGAETGEGRNVTMFDQLRRFAYQEIRSFHGNLLAFRIRLLEMGREMNMKFESRLSDREVGSIARSIAKWTTEHFSPERFSEIQRARANRRWAGRVIRSEPWEALGMSRATYYRKKKVGMLGEE